MTPTTHRRPRHRAVSAALVVALCAAVALPIQTPAWAAPSATPSATPSDTESAGSVAPNVSASLLTSSTAVTATGTLSYTAVIRCSAAPSYLQARLSVERPDGRLVYRKTLIAPPGTGTDVTFSFQRELADLGLSTGVHPVKLEVRAEIEGELATDDVSTDLLVVGTRMKRVPTAVVFTVDEPSMTGPDGTLAIDPATSLKARQDVSAICEAVLANPDLKLTLGVSPLMLQQWRAVSQGYQLTEAQGPRQVPATDIVPLLFTQTLDLLGNAVSTGRLELLRQGYADADLGQLEQYELLGDVEAQYRLGDTVRAASLTATPSAGTAPADGDLGPGGAGALSALGVDHAVVSGANARSKNATAATGAYRVQGADLVALVTDSVANAGLTHADASGLTRGSFGRSVSRKVTPFVASVALGPEDPNASDVLAGVVPALSQQWVTPVLAAEAAAQPYGRAVQLHANGRRGASSSYWASIAKARVAARALVAMAEKGDPDATRADQSSLISECFCWVEAGSTGATIARGRAFAEDAEKVAGGVLSAISIKAAEVTLAGARGDVPVTITNGTDKTLKVILSPRALSGMRVKGRAARTISLRPKENYTEIPVDLGSSLSGKMRVRVLSAGYVVTSTSATVSASYLDKLVAVLGIVALLGILLAFIVRRVRDAEKSSMTHGDDAASRRSRYTLDETSDPESGK